MSLCGQHRQSLCMSVFHLCLCIGIGRAIMQQDGATRGAVRGGRVGQRGEGRGIDMLCVPRVCGNIRTLVEVCSSEMARIQPMGIR